MFLLQKPVNKSFELRSIRREWDDLKSPHFAFLKEKGAFAD